MKIKEFLNNLEFNKQTDDIKSDLKVLNAKAKLKLLGLKLVAVGAGLAIVFTVVNHIKKDEFKSNLLKNGYSPLSTLFVKDYKDELISAQKELEKVEKQAEQLNQKYDKLYNVSLPRFDDEKFLQEAWKTKKVQEAFKKAKTDIERKMYLDYYYYFLFKNYNNAITINSKQYTIKQIVEKVENISDVEKNKLLEVPANEIIKETYFKHKDILIEALKTLNKAKKSKNYDFYTNFNFSTLRKYKDKNLEKRLKAQMSNYRSSIIIKAENGYTTSYDKITFDNPLITLHTKAKDDYKKKYDEFYKNQKQQKIKLQKEMQELQAKAKKLQKLIFDISALANDKGIHYKTYKKEVEKDLKEIK